LIEPGSEREQLWQQPQQQQQPRPETQDSPQHRGRVVTANRTPKTLKVEVGFLWRHPKYGKYLRRTSRLTVHDEKSEARQGDQVQITECRPISKTKSWRW